MSTATQIVTLAISISSNDYKEAPKAMRLLSMDIVEDTMDKAVRTLESLSTEPVSTTTHLPLSI